MNSKSVIYQTNAKVVEVRQFILEKLNKTITYLAKTDLFFVQNQNIRVKITGDATSISRSMHYVVVAFQ